MRTIARLLAMLAAMSGLAAAQAQPGRAPLVLAAASLQESMGAAADAWARKRHPRPAVSFAASSTLARQVRAGGAADLFVSADADWMDVLQRARLIVPGTRADLAGNRLVVVTTRANGVRLSAATLGRVLSAGPVAMADPDAVPAGRYGREALERLGAWRAVAPHVVRAENVRAALALVERGAARYGIVYATDARAARGVRVAGLFPQRSHAPIVYPLARLRTSTSAEAEGFRRFLLSPEGRAIFECYGFTRP